VLLAFLYAGLARGGIKMQKVKKNYAKAAELLIGLASLQASFVTLDSVIKMTNRRVRAIEHGTIRRRVSSTVFSRPYLVRSRYWYSVACVVCRLSVTLCIVAKRCVLEQKLLLRAYRKSYMRNRWVPK